MLACRIHAKEDLRIEPQDEPTPGRGEVLLALGAGGICGSDLHYFHEGRNGGFVVREPLVPGHEASAVVVAIGEGVTRVKVGDKVAVSPSHACGRCAYCRGGREQLCENMRFLGSASVFPHTQGFFRERFVMGERQCYPVEGDISLGEIAFAEPLSPSQELFPFSCPVSIHSMVLPNSLLIFSNTSAPISFSPRSM